jgi:hypothetical protein
MADKPKPQVVTAEMIRKKAEVVRGDIVTTFANSSGDEPPRLQVGLALVDVLYEIAAQLAEERRGVCCRNPG